MDEIVVPHRNRRPLIEHRICAHCQTKKPLTEDCFSPHIRKKSGFRGICKKCEKKRALAKSAQ